MSLRGLLLAVALFAINTATQAEPADGAADTGAATPTENQPETAAAPTPRETEPEDWIMRIAPDSVILQLLGSSNEQALHDYADQYLVDVQPPARILTTRVDNKTWYLLVMGPFPNHEMARQVIATLPREIQSNNPWIRPTDSLQQMR